MTPVLQVIGIGKRFGELAALDNIDLSLQAGERRGILGPNGAGKSTFFDVITGFQKPLTGRVVLFGHDCTDWAPFQRARLGLARTFQVTRIFADLTVRDNVALAVQAKHPLAFSLLRSRAGMHELHQEVEALLGRWRLAERADDLAAELSYGEKRQLELALALAHRPRLLLLDEPTAGLSPPETANFIRIIQEIDRDVGMLIIEHDLDVAFALVDRITVLAQGRVFAEGTVDEIRADSRIDEIYMGLAAEPRC